MGADVVMMASALFKYGPEHLGAVLEGVRAWFDERGHAAIEQARAA
ncbi:MAG TPA: hypothetical protein VNO79_04895 [Actinomycetota bacterium]|nr:hypothetical protein [Actinomycetota bacterium]